MEGRGFIGTAIEMEGWDSHRDGGEGVHWDSHRDGGLGQP